MSLSNVVIINIFQLCFNIEMSSSFCKKRTLNRNVDECEFRLNDVLLMNEDKSLNVKKFFETIDKKTC